MFSKLLTQITKSNGILNFTLFDIKSKLYIAKDDIPLDPDIMYLFVDYLKMYTSFVDFYGNDSEIENDQNNQKSETFESQIALSNDEIIYLKEFNNSFCFVLFLSGDTIDNKFYLDFNLDTLKKTIKETVEELNN